MIMLFNQNISLCLFIAPDKTVSSHYMCSLKSLIFWTLFCISFAIWHGGRNRSHHCHLQKQLGRNSLDILYILCIKHFQCKTTSILLHWQEYFSTWKGNSVASIIKRKTSWFEYLRRVAWVKDKSHWVVVMMVILVQDLLKTPSPTHGRSGIVPVDNIFMLFRVKAYRVWQIYI